MRDKVVIVTGASSGIGKACAEAFSAAGARVVLAARNTEALNETSRALKGESLTVTTDVRSEDDCRRLVEQAVAGFGQIDVLINNAGISMRALLKDLSLDVIRQVMDVNFWGAVYCTKYALPHLLKSRGSVVGVSSIAGFKGLPGRTGYAASKFALHGFLDALRVENLKTGLHVLIACPGFTGTRIRERALNASGEAQGSSPRDEGKMMRSEQVARRIYKATVKRRRMVIMTMEGRLTVLGTKFFPALTDRMVYKQMSKEPNSPFS
jgi:NAD(P)-dependent dehydrogenase (short-subunit alcohol dehydrogenase family)